MISFKEFINEISRREFLGTAGTGLAGLALGQGLQAGPPPPRTERPKVEVSKIETLNDKNLIPVEIQFISTGNSKEDAKLVAASINIEAVRQLNTNIDNYLGPYGILLGQYRVMDYPQVINTNIFKDMERIIRYSTKTDERTRQEVSDKSAGKRAEAKFEFYVIYVDSKGNIIKNVDKVIKK